MPFGFGIGIISTDNLGDGAVTNAKVAAAAAIVETKISPNPGTHAAASAPHSGHARITAGSYVGNNTANRAIPHGLGIVPKAVHTWTTNVVVCGMSTSGLWIATDNASGNGGLAVTGWDATNYYVGNATSYRYSANENGYTHYWVAIG